MVMIFNEREQAFFDWMVGDDSRFRALPIYVRGYVGKLRKVAQAERINPDGNFLDDEFRLNGLVRLYTLYTYEDANALNNDPNPTRMIIRGSLVRNITTYKSRINQYKEFCEYEVRLLQRG